ncbi:phosphatase PAP2 family protein [Actinospica robiniae]|uniref:phosphatase PAP2 family protein n=1 Tax=Actinospica robiniae TaxID=304901 RepID=UPI0003F6FB5E|nr:phosphatase PAP2 family protein [Actinospica robiniae]
MNARRLLVTFACCVAGLSAGMILLGLLCTGILAHSAPLTGEDHVDVFFAAHRVPWANTVTDLLCLLAGTYGAAVVALAMVIWARWHYKSGAEPLCIAFAILLELSTFLITTAIVHRSRPAVAELDASPPTSSFPSGHTAAAVALYGILALIVYRHSGRRIPWLLLLIPAAVGVARLYRGMHHPSDVVAGAILGALAVWAAQHFVLRAHQSPEPVATASPELARPAGRAAR